MTGYLEGAFPDGNQAARLRAHGWVLVSSTSQQIAISPDGRRTVAWPAALAELDAGLAAERKAERGRR